MGKLQCRAGFTACLMIGFCSVVSVDASAASRSLPVPATAHHDPFHCDAHACAMPRAGAYPYLIVGRFKTKASAVQSTRLFSAMRVQHRWSQLPPNADTFRFALQPVAIELEDGSTLAVLMTRKEARIAAPKPGDLVRYSPHRGKFEIPPTDPVAKAWWSVDGCVAVICRAGDAACFKRYARGVYSLDGVAISPHTQRPVPGHVAIDPDSLLPKPTAPTIN